jgi:thioredoxin reductase (NADPH)
MEKFDICIIGAGPAGLCAAIHAVRCGKKTLLLDKGLPGGQLNWASCVKNYPGFENITGQELSSKIFVQAKNQGVVFSQSNVLKISNSEENVFKKIVVSDSEKFSCDAIIIAVGRTAGKLNVPGEIKFEKKGIHHSAVFDSAQYSGKEVAIIGGGDSALKDAIHVSELAKKVFVIHRRNELRAEKKLQEEAFEIKNIEFVWNSVVKEFLGKEKLEKLLLFNNKDNKEAELNVDGVFVCVGHYPSTENFNVEKDDFGFILVNENLETNINGVFAAGDCVKKKIAQMATAVGDGAIAGINASCYVDEVKKK